MGNIMKKIKYFSAKWCGPCKVFKPIMKELSSEGYDIEFIDGDDNPKIANEYNIRSVPTTIVEENGIEVGRFLGARTKTEMIEVLS
tara:strand:- start:240 stop:497 length:258 start_codon:yes stop_codon:yes gene_type:complete